MTQSGGDPSYDFYVKERDAFFRRWQLHVEPSMNASMAWAAHSVSYGQMALRSALLLNGGAIIAVPAFAEMFGGGLWDKGAVWPFVALCAFLLGLMSALLGVAGAFFAVGNYSGRHSEIGQRFAKQLHKNFSDTLKGHKAAVASDYEEETPEESQYKKRGDAWNRAAILLGMLSIGSFIVGAVLGAYMISGGPPTSDVSAESPTSSSSVPP